MVTERDMRVLELLTQLRYMTTKQLKDTIFKDVSYSVCYRRLNYLSSNKLIYRKYYNLGKNTNCYVYYLDKAPRKKNLAHELLVSQFIVELISQGHEILEIDKAPIYKGIKPDLIVKFRKLDGTIKHLFLEVQLSKYDTIGKYLNINPMGEADIPNLLYVVTDKPQKLIQIRNLRIVIDTLDFKKLQFYFS